MIFKWPFKYIKATCTATNTRTLAFLVISTISNLVLHLHFLLVLLLNLFGYTVRNLVATEIQRLNAN